MKKGSWREFDDVESRLRPNLRALSDKSQRQVRVNRTRGGRKGKTVTLIRGLELDVVEAKSLLKRIKTVCGTGGAVKGEFLELQGDQVKVVLEILQKEGYNPKQSGG